MTDQFDEYTKPRKVRKAKPHFQKPRYDDEIDEVHNRKAAGKKNHSRIIHVEDIDEDDPYVEQYIHLIK